MANQRCCCKNQNTPCPVCDDGIPNQIILDLGAGGLTNNFCSECEIHALLSGEIVLDLFLVDEECLYQEQDESFCTTGNLVARVSFQDAGGGQTKIYAAVQDFQFGGGFDYEWTKTIGTNECLDFPHTLNSVTATNTGVECSGSLPSTVTVKV